MGSKENRMVFFPLLSLFLLRYSLTTIIHCHADHGSCKPDRCSKHGPIIRFPFRLQDRQPQLCGYPGFNLSCNDKQTMIHIPSLGRDVVVEQIDYKEQTLAFADPNSCLWRLIFDKFSLHRSHAYDSPSFSALFTLVNCSKTVEYFYMASPVSCLSDAEHGAFVIPQYYYNVSVGYLPASCQPIKTISVPLLYPLGLNTTQAKLTPQEEQFFSFTLANRVDEGLLRLMWYVLGCVGCEQSGRKCRYKDSHTSDTICFYEPHGGFQRKHVIIVSSVGSFLLLAIIAISVAVYLSWKSNRKLDLENEIMVEKFLEDYKYLKPTRYSYADLKRMTSHFKENLGQGGYGSVFKGTLSNGTLVAVKILKSFGGDGQEFINEVGTIGKIHHVNVVRLLGFCADRMKRGLIYEFMPNESLEKYIFNTNANDHFFTWEKLQGIAIGVAKGIEYLHQGCDQRILHFDIKPHNILLDGNFNPKISDFGLAKLCSKGQSVVSVTAARGTIGYIAPEVFSRNFGNVSYKSDVYSFGMLLLEMVGGRRNIDVTAENTSQAYFPEWIYNRLCHYQDMGLKFEREEDASIAKKLIIVALWCIQWCPGDRPSMKSVVHMLEGSIERLAMPSDPFGSSSPTIKIRPTNLSTISE